MNALDYLDKKQLKDEIPAIKVGDTVSISQKIVEGSKERIQKFEGVVIKISRRNSSSARIIVRKIANGVAMEKSWMIHSPLIVKIDILRRAKTRRAYLSYLRNVTGKATKLKEIKTPDFGVLKFDKSFIEEFKKIKASEVSRFKTTKEEVVEATEDVVKQEA